MVDSLLCLCTLSNNVFFTLGNTRKVKFVSSYIQSKHQSKYIMVNLFPLVQGAPPSTCGWRPELHPTTKQKATASRSGGGKHRNPHGAIDFVVDTTERCSVVPAEPGNRVHGMAGGHRP